MTPRVPRVSQQRLLRRSGGGRGRDALSYVARRLLSWHHAPQLDAVGDQARPEGHP